MKQLIACLALLCAGIVGCGRGVDVSAPRPTGENTQASVHIFSMFAPDKSFDVPPPDLSDPLVYGVSWRFKWETLEPEEGKYNWENIDKLLAMTQCSGKKAMIRVTAGMFSPQWIYAAGARPFEFTTHAIAPGHGSYMAPVNKMPLPWDPVYLLKWDAFVRAMGQHYNGDSRIYCVHMTGGGYIGEMNLPKAVDKWRQAAYTDQKLISAWKQIITSYRGAFPDTPTTLNFNEPLGKDSNVMLPLTDWVLATYPRQVFLQEDALKANFKYDGIIRRTIRMASSRTTVGYQMLGGRGWIDEETGDRRQAFANAREDHVSYVEVYSSDIHALDLRDHLHFLAYGK